MSMYDSSSQFGSYLNTGVNDVWAYIDNYLDSIGLSELKSFTRNLNQEFGSDLSADQFTQRIRETEQYKTRFKAIDIARKNGMPIPSESDVLAAEKGYAAVAQQSGMPANFYDSPDDFANLIGRGVSPQEYQTRILDGYTAVRNDPRIQSELNRLYESGLNDGDLVAFYLDPERATSAIQLRQSAATIASKSSMTGFGGITKEQAERLAGQGITSAQAQQGFEQLGAQRGLFNGLASENGDIDSEVGIASTFENNADATDQLARRRQARQAQFSGGGSYTKSNNGTTGIGSSNN